MLSPIPSPASKASFQVNRFGGANSVRAEEMYQFGIIPVDQSVYFLNAEFFQMIYKFINQQLTDTLMLVMGINADGIQACLFPENTIFSHIEFSHYKPHYLSVFFLGHKRRGQIIIGFKKLFKLHLIVLRPGSLEYFLVNPNHGVKIFSFHESNFNGALVHGISFLF